MKNIQPSETKKLRIQMAIAFGRNFDRDSKLQIADTAFASVIPQTLLITRTSHYEIYCDCVGIDRRYRINSVYAAS